MSLLIPNTQDNLVDIILNTVDDPMMVTDGDGVIVRVNRAFEDTFGWRTEEAVGQTPKILNSRKHDDAFFHRLWDALAQDGFWEGKIWNMAKSGDEIETDCRIKTQFNDDGQVLYYVSRMKVETVEEGEKARNHDNLTGLPDQHLFSDRLDQAMIAVRRVDKSVALLHIGLDHFSTINDGLGYETGDQLLKQISERLHDCMRGSDTVARLGGDLFAMALQVSSIDDGVVVAEKVLKSMQKTFDIEGKTLNMTASIGISLYPKDAEHAADLMKLADTAMHHAKKQGGNAYKFFAEDMNAKAKNRLEMETAIRKGLSNREFVLYYQPKVSSKTEQIVGAEALIRWISPERGFMPPGDFIPVAEETGLIGDIGSWVLQEAARQNKSWQDAGLPKVRVAVNVAAPQFKAPDFIDHVLNALDNNDLEPQWLELEIVESMLMGDTEMTVQKLHEVREVGCHLSIDDFGTGYSSLSYLTRFPITTLKIDRAFIKDLECDKTMAEISRAIIGMSQGLELEVVAEGAETDAHIQFLRENGCQTVQGFYYSKPVPADEFAELLKNGIPAHS
ncbi:EAL domain-containing protein [Terasakiella sp. A23]|uniref:putative bifunctional diguanylate cyclase/phosphodiesterase n=1 Tax=Terasakiella sp. FCG-A23 TaxID=3080561 RepID=UPI0029533146|nr:EAL domain-containing protein [Terasakiella sp. A23]MDV7339417.1 EAL domain-containing protein [Terasakiella sp. A23]